MDNTMFDNYGHVINYSKKFYDGFFVEKEKALQDYRTHTWFDLPEEQAKNIVRSLHGDVNFWATMPLKEESIVGILQFLMEHFDIYIATATTTNAPEATFLGKIYSIRKHFPNFDFNKLIFCKYKFFLKGDFIIDDLVHTLYGPDKIFEGKKIIFDYPYNRGVGDYRVYDWWDIKEYFERLL